MRALVTRLVVSRFAHFLLPFPEFTRISTLSMAIVGTSAIITRRSAFATEASVLERSCSGIAVLTFRAAQAPEHQVVLFTAWLNGRSFRAYHTAAFIFVITLKLRAHHGKRPDIQNSPRTSRRFRF